MTEVLSVDASAREVVRRPPAEARISRLKSLALGSILPILLFGGWELAVRLGWAEGRLLPAPSRVLATLVGLSAGGELAAGFVEALGAQLDGPGIGAGQQVGELGHLGLQLGPLLGIQQMRILLQGLWGG